MSEITDEMRAAVADAINWPPVMNRDMALAAADRVLSAVAPLIAAQEREACAMVAGDGARRFSHLSDKYRALMGVAFAIRGRAESKEG